MANFLQLLQRYPWMGSISPSGGAPGSGGAMTRGPAPRRAAATPVGQFASGRLGATFQAPPAPTAGPRQFAAQSGGGTPDVGAPDPWYTNLLAQQQYAASGGAGDTSWESDPQYQATLNLINQRVLPQAASGYLAAMKNALLGFGSRELAQSYLNPVIGEIAKYEGHPEDLGSFYNTLSPEGAISENQNTTLGNLLHAYNVAIGGAHAGEAARGLFFSSARLKQEGEIQRNRLAQEADARQKLIAMLGGYGSAYQNAVTNALFQEQQAASDAKTRKQIEQQGSGQGGTTGESTYGTTPTYDTPAGKKPPPLPKVRKVAAHSTVGQLTGTPGYGGGRRRKKR